MIPHISENPRNRKYTKRRRKRLFNAAIHALRMRVKRTFAWEDKFQRLRLRFERIPAAALWHEIEGVHDDQPASILRCLKLPSNFLRSERCCGLHRASVFNVDESVTKHPRFPLQIGQHPVTVLLFIGLLSCIHIGGAIAQHAID